MNLAAATDNAHDAIGLEQESQAALYFPRPTNLNSRTASGLRQQGNKPNRQSAPSKDELDGVGTDHTTLQESSSFGSEEESSKELEEAGKDRVPKERATRKDKNEEESRVAAFLSQMPRLQGIGKNRDDVLDVLGRRRATPDDTTKVVAQQREQLNPPPPSNKQTPRKKDQQQQGPATVQQQKLPSPENREGEQQEPFHPVDAMHKRAVAYAITTPDDTTLDALHKRATTHTLTNPDDTTMDATHKRAIASAVTNPEDTRQPSYPGPEPQGVAATSKPSEAYLQYLDDTVVAGGCHDQGPPPVNAPRVAPQPGAFAGAPGEGLHRRDDVRFSRVGVSPPQEEITTQNNHNSVMAPGGGLAEALPVEEDDLPDMEAQPYDVEAVEKRMSERTNQQRKSFLFGLVCIVFGVIIGVVSYNKQKEAAGNLSPTVAPSFAPSESPSSAPSGALDLLREGLPEYTLASLKSYGTPQQRAMDWLENHPELPGMEESRKRQLFALVTFYYAMDGDNWPLAIKDRWLLYDDECYWFSDEFGDLEDGSWVEKSTYNVTPCNEQNEYQLLLLARMKLESYNLFIPPEISLLTSLSILSLPMNDINASLADFLPTQLYQMSNLTKLWLHMNSLHGSIPTELGRLAAMGEFLAYKNDLTGDVPSQLGLMLAFQRSWAC